MTALKYHNKKKRKGYWKIYDRTRIKDFRKVWNFSLERAQKLGNPFPKKDNRGRKPKLERYCYAAICIILAYFDLRLRDMEGEIPLLANETLGHSTLEWWFEKLDVESAIDLLGITVALLSQAVQADLARKAKEIITLLKTRNSSQAPEKLNELTALVQKLL